MKDTKKRNIYKTPVVAMVTAFSNMVILNFLFIVTSLPIFTIGVSYSSMFSVIKEMEGQDIYVTKRYFAYFKEQFKQSTKCFLLPLGILFILYFEFMMLYQVNANVPSIIYVCLIIPFLFVLTYIPWLLLQSSYFYCTFSQQIKNGFLLMIRFVPQSILIMVLTALPFIAFAMWPAVFVFAWPVWLFMYFASSTSWIYKAVRIPMKNLSKQFEK
ncbi:MAG: YesL family protein [Firmicutes bacterium]|nr:YesL family protein [Candidatus Colivicinus equi]